MFDTDTTPCSLFSKADNFTETFLELKTIVNDLEFSQQELFNSLDALQRIVTEISSYNAKQAT